MSTSTEEAEAKYKKRDDASARLAEKMLQVRTVYHTGLLVVELVGLTWVKSIGWLCKGWTMLGVNCPSDDCFTPLMRSKQGKVHKLIHELICSCY